MPNPHQFHHSHRLHRIAFSCVLAIIWMSAITAHAQSNAAPAPILPRYIGGGISANFNDHSLNLPVYRGSTVCGNFSSGNSILPDGFLLFEMPLGETTHSLWITPRLRVSDESVLLSTPATDQVRGRSPIDSSLVATDRVHKLDATLLGLAADLFVKYPIADRLFAFAGPSLTYLITKSADQTETITSPSGAVFDGTTSPTRTIASGDIPNSSALQFSGTAGMSLDLPLSRSVILAPELSVTLPFTKIRTDADWTVTRITLGAALKFDITPTPELLVIRKPDTTIPPPLPKSDITASIRISGVKDSAGQQIEIPNPELRIEETARREAFPMLNYVFFEADSTVLPKRYELFASPATADTFHYESLASSTELGAYHQMLNVLGKRLRDQPSATVTLTAAVTPTSTEAVATARANAIKQYWTSIWKIPSSRIQVASTTTLDNASNPSTPQGAEENDHVEITSNSPSLLDPVNIETVDRAMNPPKLRLRAFVNSALPLKVDRMTLRQANQVLVQFNSARAMEDWTPSEQQLPTTEVPLVATLNLTDSLGMNASAFDTAYVKQITIRKKRLERVKDKIIEHYNLITFDFDKADIGPRANRIISTIAAQIKSGDVVNVRGFTDLLGESVHNQKLSQARATAVADALQKAIPQSIAKGITVTAYGEGKTNLVDNRLPEGRFLSRTVQVTIEHTVEGDHE